MLVILSEATNLSSFHPQHTASFRAEREARSRGTPHFLRVAYTSIQPTHRVPHSCRRHGWDHSSEARTSPSSRDKFTRRVERAKPLNHCFCPLTENSVKPPSQWKTNPTHSNESK